MSLSGRGAVSRPRMGWWRLASVPPGGEEGGAAPRNERDRERRKKRKAAKMAAAEEEKAMGGTEELPALAQIRAEQERIKKQRQSLNSYEREGKAMFAKLRSLCAVPDREEVEEQDDSDEEEDLEKTELRKEVQDLKEEVQELKKELDEAKKEPSRSCISAHQRSEAPACRRLAHSSAGGLRAKQTTST